MKFLTYLYGAMIGAGVTVAVFMIMQQMKKAKENKKPSATLNPASNQQPTAEGELMEDPVLQETATQRSY